MTSHQKIFYFIQAFVIGLDSHTTQDALEIFCRGAAVATEGSEEVSGHVTHSGINTKNLDVKYITTALQNLTINIFKIFFFFFTDLFQLTTTHGNKKLEFKMILNSLTFK